MSSNVKTPKVTIVVKGRLVKTRELSSYHSSVREAGRSASAWRTEQEEFSATGGGGGDGVS